MWHYYNTRKSIFKKSWTCRHIHNDRYNSCVKLIFDKIYRSANQIVLKIVLTVKNMYCTIKCVQKSIKSITYCVTQIINCCNCKLRFFLIFFQNQILNLLFTKNKLQRQCPLPWKYNVNKLLNVYVKLFLHLSDL